MHSIRFTYVLVFIALQSSQLFFMAMAATNSHSATGTATTTIDVSVPSLEGSKAISTTKTVYGHKETPRYESFRDLFAHKTTKRLTLPDSVGHTPDTRKKGTPVDNTGFGGTPLPPYLEYARSFRRHFLNPPPPYQSQVSLGNFWGRREMIRYYAQKSSESPLNREDAGHELNFATKLFVHLKNLCEYQILPLLVQWDNFPVSDDVFTQLLNFMGKNLMEAFLLYVKLETSLGRLARVLNSRPDPMLKRLYERVVCKFVEWTLMMAKQKTVVRAVGIVYGEPWAQKMQDLAIHATLPRIQMRRLVANADGLVEV